MKGKNHLTCGVAAGVGCAAIAMNFNNINITEAVTVAACSSVASLLPDIDMPNSKLGKKIGPVSKIIYKLFGHRTITHSILWTVPLFVLLSININNDYSFILTGALIGFLSHIFSDTMTRGGVPWLWPLKTKRYHLTNINSGEHDTIFIILTDIILVGAFYILTMRFGLNLGA